MGASKVFSFFIVLEPPLTWYQCYCIFLWTQHYHNYSTKIIMLQYYWNHHRPKEKKQPAITRKRDWLCPAQHCAILLWRNMISKLEILFRCDKQTLLHFICLLSLSVSLTLSLSLSLPHKNDLSDSLNYICKEKQEPITIMIDAWSYSLFSTITTVPNKMISCDHDLEQQVPACCSILSSSGSGSIW